MTNGWDGRDGRDGPEIQKAWPKKAHKANKNDGKADNYLAPCPKIFTSGKKKQYSTV